MQTLFLHLFNLDSHRKITINLNTLNPSALKSLSALGCFYKYKISILIFFLNLHTN
jgi:hypothetical protein